MIRGVYKSLKNIADPAKRFDNFVYAYAQIGYLGAAIQGMISTKQVLGSQVRWYAEMLI